MNLIEKLGGYEKAKDKFRDNGSFHSDRIKSALLQYRRENNIFEVGDFVVSDYYELDSIFRISHVCNVDEYIYSNKLLTGYELVDPCRFNFNEVSHATPEEIKAGHRL